MTTFLLDTNILSEPVQRSPNVAVLQRLALHRTEIALAATVWHELWDGYWRLPSSHRRTVIRAYLNELLIDAVPIIPYDVEAAEWHAAERSRLAKLGQTPAFADGQIAAVAAVNGLTLATRNIADFALFQGLVIENWFDLPP